MLKLKRKKTLSECKSEKEKRERRIGEKKTQKGTERAAEKEERQMS